MATTFSSSDTHFDSTVVARDVADDLASIFGADRRDSMPLAPQSEAVSGGRPTRRRGVAMALLGVAGLAVMATGGLLIGHEATGGAPLAAPAQRTAVRAASADPATPVVALTAATPPAPDATPVESPAIDDEIPAMRVDERPPVAPGRAPARTRLADQATMMANDDVAAPTRAYPVVDEPAPPVAAPPRRASCEESGSCADTALAMADRRVADAYDDAIGAGVGHRDLRDYRAEWVRARARATSDPRGALRIYGMVAADLDTLAHDAATRPDMAVR